MKKTERGFAIFEFKDYNATPCNVQESSLATEAAIWFGVGEDIVMQGPFLGEGWRPFKLPENAHVTSRMHLTRAQVKTLLPLLQHFVDTGALPARSPRMPKRRRR